jgi:hypothetical protein
MEDIDYDEDAVLLNAPMPELTLAEKLPRSYVSVSQINQYLKCPKAYEFRYIEEIELARNSYMVQGSALHRAAEGLHLSMMNEAKAPPVEMVLDMYADAHKELFTSDVVIEEEDGDTGKILDIGTKMMSVYYQGATGQLNDPDTKQWIPPVYPVAVERKIYMPLKPLERDPYPFMAVIDLEEPNAVADIKTKRKKGSQAEADNSLQLSLYAAATSKPDVRLDQLIKPTKTLPTRYLRTGGVRSAEEIQHAIEIGADVVDGIVVGYFPRSTPDAWWCTPKWCGYWDKCRGKKL